MAKPAFPRSILDFQERFGTDEECWQFLFDSRWPDGFACPVCCGGRFWRLKSRPDVLECAACKHQASVTAGTILHRTRTPLRLWFWAAYLMTTASVGVSAVSLQRHLGLSRYDTAWTMLHKLRRAMVDADRSKLSGEVEVDEFELGGLEPGRKGRPGPDSKAVTCVIAVEVRGPGSGRVRMKVIPDASSDTLIGFVKDNVEAGAITHTDGWSSYKLLPGAGYDHRPRSQRAAKRDGDTEPVMPRAHRAISNLKAWRHGTHRWASREHTQAYLDEFVFRYNRRRTPLAAFQTLLGLSAAHVPVTRQQIISTGPGPRPRRDQSTP